MPILFSELMVGVETAKIHWVRFLKDLRDQSEGICFDLGESMKLKI